MISSTILDNITSTDSVRSKVELYEGSTLITTCTCEDRLQGLTIDRVGQNNKFFGFGIVHKLTVRLIDMDRELSVNNNYSFKVYFGYNNNFIKPYPIFYAAEVSRDESTNTITVVAYDKLNRANDNTVSFIEAPYTIYTFAENIAQYLGLNGVILINVNNEIFNTNYATGANFEGKESLKRALDAIADVTQTIYYVDDNDYLVFKQLNNLDDPVLDITRDDCYDIESGEYRTLTTITNTDELNDSTSVTIGSGHTQFIRDNEFLETIEVEQLIEILEQAKLFCGISAAIFYCRWDGNILLEIGDKISLTSEDGSKFHSYLLNESIAFDGYLESTIEWKCEEDNNTAENPVSLGEKLTQTFARIDKANKEITLMVSDIAEDKSNISSMQIDISSITSNVSSLEDTTTNIRDDLGNLTEVAATLKEEVSTKISSDNFSIKVSETLSSGVNEIAISETGFKFDKDGLTITKSDSDIKTNIDENGLSVFSNDEEVLTADATGVKAKNLNATTYLTVGGRSTFSNYDTEDGEKRTGCFWIG